MVPIEIRAERPGDELVIREVTRAAFQASPLGHHGEAELIERLRASCPESLSLVAEIERQIVGHILFTPVVIEGAAEQRWGMGLAPMSVRPEYQLQGVGTRLVQSGIGRLRDRACGFVVVLGHPEYYPRFGFQPASRYAIKTTFPGVPDDALMVLAIDRPTDDLIAGTVRFRPEFDDV